MKWIVVLAALLAGCAALSPYDRIDTREVDGTYRKIAFAINSSGGWRSSTNVAVFIKTFESNGKLGICGYYMAGGSSSAYVDLIGVSMASPDSTLSLGGEVVGNLGFLRLNGSERDAIANCVVARADWRPSYSTAHVNVWLPAARSNG
jgi:hypothetical protein